MMKTMEFSKPAFRKALENLTYYLILGTAIAVFLAVLRMDILFRPSGGDAEVFCLAGQATQQGRNPYLTSVLGIQMSWNYPPVLAHGFNWLCSQIDFEHGYMFIYLPFLLLALIPWLNAESWVYGIVLCLTGLYNLGWVFITGNISTIEFFLFSLSAFFLIKKRNYDASFLLLGLMAGIKIIPILYFPAFLLFTKTTGEKLRASFLTAIGFLSLIFISSITNFDLMPWYFKQLLGLIPEQHAAFKEYAATIFTPLFSSMIISFLGLETIINKTGFILPLTFLATGFFASLYLWKKLKPGIISSNKLEIAFGMGVVFITLLMPRLKPYSFLPALLFFYIASRDQSKPLQGIYVALLSIFPNFLYLTYFYFDKTEMPILNPFSAFLVHFVQVIQTYHQPFFLSLALILLLISRKSAFTQKIQSTPKRENID